MRISIFDQAIGLGRQLEVLLDTPKPLKRREVDIGLLVG
jgi:hypothetical protein